MEYLTNQHLSCGRFHLKDCHHDKVTKISANPKLREEQHLTILSKMSSWRPGVFSSETARGHHRCLATAATRGGFSFGPGAKFRLFIRS